MSTTSTATPRTTTYTCTASSELMENYLQADILLPQDNFIALQTQTGTSLLFMIGSGNVFNLVSESPGQKQGWLRADLSSAQIRKDFPKGASCKTFGAAQAKGLAAGQTAHIHLAMVINDGTNDHLYISLGNSDSNLGWVGNPAWTACPFNAAGGAAPSPLAIARVFISEASDKEYIVVDTIANPGAAVEVIARFYLDVTTPAAPQWTPHALANEIDAAGYQTCLGRAANSFGGIDGLYTKGQAGPAAQLIYTPLYNYFNPAMAALPARLNLPNGLTADAIASVRNADNSSDLYATANGGLYYFKSTNQKDGATGELLYSHTLLTGVRTLYAYATGGNITVWGLNANDQVFYLTCPQAQVTAATAWNHPLALMTGVDAISPYVDRAYSANTFFAHTGSGLVKMVKTPATGLWTQRNITLPPSAVMQDPAPISSYTTHIKVTDQHGQIGPNVMVTLTATSVTSVYINHLYYVIGPTPIQIATDQFGTITIVEIAHTLAGTRFNATVAGQNTAQAINPMDTAFQRNAKYTTADSLKAAKIVDSKGKTKPFLPATVSADDLNGVAAANQSLANAYTSMTTPAAPVKATAPAKAAATTAALKSGPPTIASLGASGLGNAILVDAGDLFSTLAQGVEAVINVIEDVGNAVWHIIAAIGDAVYHAILDCVEAVVAAATWIYNQIKIAVQDVINFLQFLFGWDDILTTHVVMKNYLLQVAKSTISGLAATKAKIAPAFAELENQISQWAGIPNIEETLNLSDSQSTTSNANPPMAAQNSAPANLGVHHFKGNVGSSSSNFTQADPVESIFQDLITLMRQEQDAINAAGTAIQKDVVDQFTTLSLNEIIKRFIGILGETVVQSAQNIIDSLLDILANLVEGVIDVLTTPIEIPVLSYLYKQIAGGDDLTFLDAVCLIAAIPATLIYKAVADAAPFPSDSTFTKGLIQANSFEEVQALFVLPKTQATAAGTAPATVASPQGFVGLGLLESTGGSSSSVSTDPDAGAVLDEDALKTFAMITGVFALIGSIPLIIANTFLRAEPATAFPKLFATLACVGNLAYVSPNYNSLINGATTKDWASVVNDTVTGISVVKGAALIGAAAYSDNQPLQVAFATVETLINLLWNVPVANNAFSNHSFVTTTYQSLIPESVANFAFNVGGMLELPYTLGAKVLAVPQYALMAAYGALITVAGEIYRFAPNQSH